jgi:hypothetical protein
MERARKTRRFEALSALFDGKQRKNERFCVVGENFAAFCSETNAEGRISKPQIAFPICSPEFFPVLPRANINGEKNAAFRRPRISFPSPRGRQ